MSGIDPLRVESWLRRRVRLGCAAKVGVALGLAALGGGILFVVYWFVIGFCYFVLGQLGADADWFPWIAWVFLLLLFVGNARTDRHYLGEFSVTTGTFSNEVVTFYLPGVGMASNINPLAPDTMHAGVKIITTLLYSGPRAVVGAWRYLGEAWALAAMDVAACAAVIGYLYQRPGRADFATIVKGVPGLNPVATFPQVVLIDGVLVLSTEPRGFTLGSDLRHDLEAVLEA